MRVRVEQILEVADGTELADVTTKAESALAATGWIVVSSAAFPVTETYRVIGWNETAGEVLDTTVEAADEGDAAAQVIGDYAGKNGGATVHVTYVAKAP